jgi:uncharacterized protein
MSKNYEQIILPTIDEQLITRVRDRLLEHFELQRIVLFGSAARNEAVEGSDLDLLVVMELPEDTTTLDMTRRLHALFDGWLLPLDILVLTPHEWTRGLKLPGHIARVAATEGVPLYG